MVTLHETGLVQRVVTVRTVVAVTEPHVMLQRDNPLSKIPTLVLDDGTPLYDSRVICEYLDTLHDGAKLFPQAGDMRWQILRQQALADGLLDLLILWRQERSRTSGQQSEAHISAYRAKVHAVLNVLERDVPSLQAVPFSVAHIATGCALSYADFRFPDLSWRSGHPSLAGWHREFESRPSVKATAIEDDS